MNVLTKFHSNPCSCCQYFDISVWTLTLSLSSQAASMAKRDGILCICICYFFFYFCIFRKHVLRDLWICFWILVRIATITDGENVLHTAEKQFPPLSHKHLMCPWQRRFGFTCQQFSAFLSRPTILKSFTF